MLKSIQKTTNLTYQNCTANIGNMLEKEATNECKSRLVLFPGT